MNTIVILDSGDSYHIVHNGQGYKDGVALYSELEVDFEEIITDISISTPDILDFIHQIIGRYITYEQDKQALLHTLQHDISQVNTLFSIKKY